MALSIPLSPQASLLRLVPAALAAVLLGLTLVALSQESIAWTVLILVGLTVLAALLLSGDPPRALFLAFITTLPVGISKAVIPPDIVYYYPGLAISVADVFLLAFAPVWLYQLKVVRREALRSSPLLGFAVIYTAYLWFSAAVAVDPVAGAIMALTHTKFLLAFVIVADYVRTPGDVKAVLGAVAVGLVLQLATVAAQTVTGSALALQGSKLADPGNLTFSGGVYAFRPAGLLEHPIALADHLVFVLPALAGFAMLGPRALGLFRWWRLSALGLFTLAALLLTLSRGGWIAFAAAFAFLLVAGTHRGLFPRSRLIATILAMVLALSALAVVYPAAYLRLVEKDARSSEARWLMIDQAVLIATNHPVLGVGLGGYHRASRVEKPASFAKVDEDFRDAILTHLGVAHNKYLLTWAEHGTIGLALLLILLWKSVRLFFAVPQWSGTVSQVLGLGLASALVGQAVLYLFDHFYLDSGLLMFWVAAAVLSALGRMQQPAAARGSP